MTLDFEVAQKVFVGILHDYLGVDVSYKKDFISYAISDDCTKEPLEIPCAIARKLIIDFSMNAKAPLVCEEGGLDHRTEKVLSNANMRVSCILHNIRTRRGTVLLRV